MKAKVNNIRRLSDSEAKRLTAAFMDGCTTIEQEAELYAYYSADNIDSELEEFKDMMLWYSNGLNTVSPDSGSSGQQNYRLRYIAGIIAPLAAAIAIVAGIYINSIRVSDTTDYDMYAQYEGSYIIRNGKKITDPETIMPVILESEEFCIRLEKMAQPNIPSPDEIMFDVLSSQYKDPAIIEYVSNNLFY